MRRNWRFKTHQIATCPRARRVSISTFCHSLTALRARRAPWLHCSHCKQSGSKIATFVYTFGVMHTKLVFWSWRKPQTSRVTRALIFLNRRFARITLRWVRNRAPNRRRNTAAPCKFWVRTCTRQVQNCLPIHFCYVPRYKDLNAVPEVQAYD